MPSEAELDRAYDGWYRPANGRFGGIGDPVLRRLRGRLAGRLDRIAPPGPVLDIGAGDGALLDALRGRGREAVGIERGSSHPSVRELELAALEGGWAAIVFWHSLEHLAGAGAALDRAASMLDPGGVLVVAIPNPASVQAGVFGDRWFALDHPRHLVHVPARVLLARLEGLGLAIERVSYLRGGQVIFGWLHGWIGRLPGRPDLYDAIRLPAARRKPISAAARAVALATASALLPFAALAAGLEAVLRRGGSVYVEARNV
jgi:SAM-dependent methyltransferase